MKRFWYFIFQLCKLDLCWMRDIAEIGCIDLSVPIQSPIAAKGFSPFPGFLQDVPFFFIQPDVSRSGKNELDLVRFFALLFGRNQDMLYEEQVEVCSSCVCVRRMVMARVVVKFMRKYGFRTRCCGHHTPQSTCPQPCHALFQEIKLPE